MTTFPFILLVFKKKFFYEILKLFQLVLRVLIGSFVLAVNYYVSEPEEMIFPAGGQTVQR